MTHLNTKTTLIATLGTFLVSAVLGAALVWENDLGGTGNVDGNGNEDWPVALATTSTFPSAGRLLVSGCEGACPAEPDGPVAGPEPPAGPDDGPLGPLDAAELVPTRAAARETEMSPDGSNDEQAATEPEMPARVETQPEPASPREDDGAADAPRVRAAAPALRAERGSPEPSLPEGSPDAPARELEAPEAERPADRPAWDGIGVDEEGRMGATVEPDVPAVGPQELQTPAIRHRETCAVELCHEGYALEQESFSTPDLGGHDVGLESQHVNATDVGPVATIGPYDTPEQHLASVPEHPGTTITTPLVELHALCGYAGDACLPAGTLGPWTVTTPAFEGYDADPTSVWLDYGARAGVDDELRAYADAWGQPGPLP